MFCLLFFKFSLNVKIDDRKMKKENNWTWFKYFFLLKCKEHWMENIMSEREGYWDKKKNTVWSFFVFFFKNIHATCHNILVFVEFWKKKSKWLVCDAVDESHKACNISSLCNFFLIFFKNSLIMLWGFVVSGLGLKSFYYLGIS